MGEVITILCMTITRDYNQPGNADRHSVNRRQEHRERLEGLDSKPEHAHGYMAGTIHRRARR